MHKEERALIVLSGGVGYVVYGTESAILGASLGARVSLWTHLSVREDALDLYGFLNREELRFFRLLIGISGIGPKSALNVLSLADITTLTRAVTQGDGTYLTKVSGIGKKLSEKIVLELKEKVGTFKSDDTLPQTEIESVEALEALGYPARDTRELVRALAKEEATTQQIIKKALRTLGGHS